MRVHPLLASIVLATSAPAVAQDTPPRLANPTPVEVDEPAPDAAGTGVSLGVTVGSAYAFRGLNVYATGGQRDVAGQVAPWLAYTIPGTPVTLTYWSSYQVSGAMRGQLIDAGVGAEQDLTIAWTRELSPSLTLAAAANVYAYPFADDAMAGVAAPIYVEPAATITRRGEIDTSLQVAYLRGVQEEVAAYRYAYARASIAREVALTSTRAVTAAAAYGVKFATPLTDNRHDAQVDLSVPFALPGGVASTLCVHGAWTDLADVAATDEVFVWASLDTSVAL